MSKQRSSHICGDPNSACDAECMDLAHRAELRTKEKCDHSVTVENGVMTYSKDIECVGECSEGCCDYFRCKVCSYRFKVEHCK